VPPVLKTNVYVDGFNLYYGALKGTPYRWLDIDALCRVILPQNHINRIRYFTAQVQARPPDLQIAVRQQTYLRALSSLPHISVHLGTFRQSVVRMKVANPGKRLPSFIDVIKTEEKGSDVNLAAFMLMDCFEQDFEVAIVVSNDTDLITPMRMVREMGCSVGLLNPHPKPARDLMKVATFYRPIRKGALAASQFPPALTDAVGTFRKPPGW
jgi:uncharacterized LabA/DUF88 family protein